MKRNFNKGQGFTLIEMMIVMLVIIVLAGMVFKLMGVAGAKNEEANTKATLQKVANALEEYRAIYGKYPPVYSYPGLGQPVRYEYANERYLEAEVGPEFAQYLKNASKDKDIWSKNEGRLFTFGLLSYFVPRYKGHADRAPDIFVGDTEQLRKLTFGTQSSLGGPNFFERGPRPHSQAGRSWPASGYSDT